MVAGYNTSSTGVRNRNSSFQRSMSWAGMWRRCGGRPRLQATASSVRHRRRVYAESRPASDSNFPMAAFLARTTGLPLAAGMPLLHFVNALTSRVRPGSLLAHRGDSAGVEDPGFGAPRAMISSRLEGWRGGNGVFRGDVAKPTCVD